MPSRKNGKSLTLLFLADIQHDCHSDDDKNVDFLRHLLLLLDRLELQISNATDGCATASLPAVPRSSLVFFRTNKKTCQDYFLRIRPSIIAGAKIVRNDHLLITHATQILKELESTIPSTDVPNWYKAVNGYLRDLGRFNSIYFSIQDSRGFSGSMYSRKVYGSHLRYASLV